jgi:hypothetical protein
MSETSITTIQLFGTAATIIGFVYAFLRNFKADINAHIDRLDKKTDMLKERIFFLATGKTLAQAMLDEKMKIQEKK